MKRKLLVVSVFRCWIVFCTVVASLGLPAGAAVIVDPVTPTTVYAIIAARELHKSTDGGVTWTELTEGLGAAEIRRLFLDPQTPTTLYAIRSHSDLLKSSEGGSHWTLVSRGEKEIPLLTLAIDPQVTTTLYAGTNGSGVLKSRDGGRTWTVLLGDIPPRHTKGRGEPQGLFGYNQEPLVPAPPLRPHHTIHDLIIDPLTPTTLYAGTNGGVWKSTDGGLTWTAMNAGSRSIAPDTQDFYSPVAHLTLDPISPTTSYASVSFDGGGIVKSKDGGVSWSAPQRGWPENYAIGALEIDPQTPTTLYVAVYMAGLFKSVDSGQSWAPINSGLPLYFESRVDATSIYVERLAIDPKNPSILYALASSNGGEGLFKSTTGGTTWTYSNLGARGNAFSPP